TCWTVSGWTPPSPTPWPAWSASSLRRPGRAAGLAGRAAARAGGGRRDPRTDHGALRGPAVRRPPATRSVRSWSADRTAGRPPRARWEGLIREAPAGPVPGGRAGLRLPGAVARRRQGDAEAALYRGEVWSYGRRCGAAPRGRSCGGRFPSAIWTGLEAGPVPEGREMRDCPGRTGFGNG